MSRRGAADLAHVRISHDRPSGQVLFGSPEEHTLAEAEDALGCRARANVWTFAVPMAKEVEARSCEAIESAGAHGILIHQHDHKEGTDAESPAERSQVPRQLELTNLVGRQEKGVRGVPRRRRRASGTDTHPDSCRDENHRRVLPVIPPDRHVLGFL